MIFIRAVPKISPSLRGTKQSFPLSERLLRLHTRALAQIPTGHLPLPRNDAYLEFLELPIRNRSAVFLFRAIRKINRINGSDIFFFLFTFLFLFPSFAQQNWILEKTISVQADFFTIDNLGNIYTVKEDQLKKYNAQTQQVNLYSSKLLGKISAVDASNPLKVVLFYKNLSQIIFLDNTLTAQGDAVALESMGLELATLVCSSINNGIWVYDQRNFQLVRLDQNLKIITQTGNIIQQIGGELNPNFLFEKNNWIYLNDAERGILVFDIFGTYSKTIPLKNLNSFQIFDDFLFFEQDKIFLKFSMKTLEQKEIPLPETEYKQINANGEYIFFLKENELKIYTEK